MAQRVRSVFAGGLGWGVGMGLALGVTGALGGGFRPLAKGAMKAGLAAYDRGTALAAEASELAEDLYHEALEERALEQAARAGGTTAGNGDGRSREVLLVPREG